MGIRSLGKTPRNRVPLPHRPSTRMESIVFPSISGDLSKYLSTRIRELTQNVTVFINLQSGRFFGIDDQSDVLSERIGKLHIETNVASQLIRTDGTNRTRGNLKRIDVIPACPLSRSDAPCIRSNVISQCLHHGEILP